jgi:hypothetical protein
MSKEEEGKKLVQKVSEISDEISTRLNRPIAHCFQLQQQIEQTTKQIIQWQSRISRDTEDRISDMHKLNRALRELGDVAAYLESIDYQLDLITNTLQE